MSPPSTFGPDLPFAHDAFLKHPAGLGSASPALHGTAVAIVGAMRFPPASTALFHYLDLAGLETTPCPNPRNAARGVLRHLGGRSAPANCDPIDLWAALRPHELP